jgi:hypothetical protein
MSSYALVRRIQSNTNTILIIMNLHNLKKKKICAVPTEKKFQGLSTLKSFSRHFTIVHRYYLYRWRRRRNNN